MHLSRPLSRIFQKIRLAEPYFRLISGLAEFFAEATEFGCKWHDPVLAI